MSRRISRKPFALSALGSAAACLAWPAPPVAQAGLSVVELGRQDFLNGTSNIYAWQIRGAGADEPYPFDGTIFGDDRKPSLGSIHYTYHFDRLGLPDANSGLRAAWLTIGAMDFDSPPGEPAAVILRLDGVTQPVGEFAGTSSPDAPSSAQVITVPVPVQFLEDGELNVDLRAMRSAPGFPGNAIEVDFSRLMIETGPPDPPAPPEPPVHPVPLPRADLPAGLVLVGIVGCGLLRRFRRRAVE